MTSVTAGVSVLILLSSCAPAKISDLELLSAVEEFESQIAGKTQEEVRLELREFGEAMVGSLIQVDGAVVASKYVRENESNIYFGTTYDPEDHVYLEDLDPELDEFFRTHRYWVSVVKTFPERQVSFELAIDFETFEALTAGESVYFSATLATLIRGRSAYCKLNSIWKQSEHNA